MVKIIKDIDLIDHINDYDVILVGINTYHAMGNGFPRKVRLKYPPTYTLNTSTKYGDINKIGNRISTTGTPIFSLCFITHSYNFRPDLHPDYLNYDALENCIKTANIEFSGLNVATTMLGCSKFDGNGDKDRVMEILNRNSDKINLFVYDYVQMKGKIENAIRHLSIINNESYDKKKKDELIKEAKEEDKKLNSMDNINKRLERIKDEVKALLNN
jgi:hypothetical protein